MYPEFQTVTITEIIKIYLMTDIHVLYAGL